MEGKVGDILGTRVIDISGNLYQLGVDDNVSPVVLVFLNTGCPIAQKYIPTLKELFQQAKDLKIQFFGVFSDPNISLLEVQRFHDEYELTFPVLFDSSGDLALRLKPKVTPEAFLIDPLDHIVYRGRIDNRFASLVTRQVQRKPLP